MKKEDEIKEVELINDTLGMKGDHEHNFPVNLITNPIPLNSTEDGRRLHSQLKNGILQYIPMKCLCVFLIILDILAWFWPTGNMVIYYICNGIVSISVTISLYWLVFFFHILHEELRKYNPLMKFLVIKGVLFLSFWQEMILWYFNVPLSHSRFIPPNDRADADEVFSALLINIEMVIMSILTAFAYSYKDFAESNNEKNTSSNNLVELMNV